MWGIVWLANPRKQIWFGFKQPLVGEKRCVTTQITAAEETNRLAGALISFPIYPFYRFNNHVNCAISFCKETNEQRMKTNQAFIWSNGKWIQTHNVYFARPKPDAHVSMRVDLPLELCAAGLLLAKPYRCTIFAQVKILFKFYNNCKYSFYNLSSSYKSSFLHALRAVYYD